MIEMRITGSRHHNQMDRIVPQHVVNGSANLGSGKYPRGIVTLPLHNRRQLHPGRLSNYGRVKISPGQPEPNHAYAKIFRHSAPLWCSVKVSGFACRARPSSHKKALPDYGKAMNFSSTTHRLDPY